MTILDKALELTETNYHIIANNNTFPSFSDAQLKRTTIFKLAVRFALVTVNEIILTLNEIEMQMDRKVTGVFDQEYWEQIEKEIKNL